MWNAKSFRAESDQFDIIFYWLEIIVYQSLDINFDFDIINVFKFEFNETDDKISENIKI